MIRERPIIFSGPLIPPLLDGRKFQTRRPVKPQPEGVGHTIGPLLNGRFGVTWSTTDRTLTQMLECPYGKPGDRLWVRETFKAGQLSREKIRDGGLPHLDEHHFRATIQYAASPGEFFTRDVHLEHWRLWLEDGWKRWKPSIHMPRWASRITLELTGVRVERLQDISEEDAKAEGLSTLTKDNGRTWKFGIPDLDGLPGNDNHGWHWQEWEVDPRLAFRKLWESIHGPGSWDANPWLWVLAFRRLQDV